MSGPGLASADLSLNLPAIAARPASPQDVLSSPTVESLKFFALSNVKILWKWLLSRIRLYREVAPLAGLAYWLWKRRQWQKQLQEAAAELREGRFMQQCTLLLVDVDGLRKTADPSSRISVPTLFSRTLRSLLFENRNMVELVTEAANRATVKNPLLDLGADGWLVMANINAHLMESFGAFGHLAAACGHSVEIVEFLFGLVNDRTTTSRHQLRVYVVKESALRNLPPAEALDLSRGSSRSAFYILQAMAAAYRPPPEDLGHRHRVVTPTHGLPSGMGRTWLTFPKNNFTQPVVGSRL
eukprot:TRINITY_DN82248_c0_g1_i1.p1 TRINITY_DN82248_c0_g1~~TRINITY_DN82248_c0_g1_i1.p1  ORF type:complete len:298 (-),score=46.83 TRINITY_DN82248_c0_g1_i1:67-960(-)